MLRALRYLMCISGLLASPTALAENSLADKIWRVGDNSFVTLPQLVADLAARPAILIGETHGSGVDQDREAFLITTLAQQSRYPDLVLEMLDAASAAKVAKFRKAHPEQTDGLAETLQWWNSGWPDFATYQPVFNAAFNAKLEVVGADILPAEKVMSSATFDVDPLVLASWQQTMQAAQCGLLHEAETHGAALLQIRRDRAFAAAMERIPAARGAFLIAGLEHVRKDRGVPRVLAAKSVVVALIAAQASQDPASYLPKSLNGEQVYDYVWFSRGGIGETSCERLRKKGLIR